MAHVGYRRVSSKDQNPDRQLANVEVDEMFTDKYTGKTRDRPALNDCFRYMRKGDTLHIHSMDRLARNLIDLQKIVEELVEKGIGVEFHKERISVKGDMDPISKLLMQLMGAVAEMELSLIRERQKEGIEAARLTGKRWGAKPKATIELGKQAVNLLKMGFSKSYIARHLKVSRTTLYKALPEAAKNKIYPKANLPIKKHAEMVWQKISKIPLDKNKCILKPFAIFPVGTSLAELYAWVENTFNISIAIDLMHTTQHNSGLPG